MNLQILNSVLPSSSACGLQSRVNLIWPTSLPLAVKGKEMDIFLLLISGFYLKSSHLCRIFLLFLIYFTYPIFNILYPPYDFKPCFKYIIGAVKYTDCNSAEG